MTIAVVQVATVNYAADPVSVSLAGVTIGNGLVGLLSAGVSGGVGLNISTSAGSTTAWTVDKHSGAGSVVAWGFAVAQSASVTALFETGNAGGAQCSLFEVAPAVKVDVKLANSGTSTSQPTGALTPSGAGELFAALCAIPTFAVGVNFPISGGWTNLGTAGPSHPGVAVYQVNAGSGALSATFTTSDNEPFVTEIVAFQPANPILQVMIV